MFIQCLILFWFFLLLFLLLSLWIYWNSLIGVNLFRESLSSYECGFDSKDLSRLPFSLRFFLIIIFFIILDVEVCLLLQLPFELNNSLFNSRIWFLIFISILLLGVIEELRLGLLSWKH